MSSASSDPMERLLRLNSSSSNFNDRVCNILYGAEYSQWVEGVNGDDVARLIDFLDIVRFCGSLSPSRSNPGRLSVLSNLPVPVSGDVCESLGKYAARERYYQHRTRPFLKF